MSLTQERTRPEPKSLAEREAAIGRYGVKGLKTMEARNGVAFSFTLTRDGADFARVREEGNGGMVFIDTKTRADFDAIVQDAIDWYVGSGQEIDACLADNTLPHEVEGSLVWELYEREQERKQLMKITCGGKAVLFQIGDEVRGPDFGQWTGVAVSGIDNLVGAAIQKAAGKPVRVVSRDPADLRVLRDEIHNL